MRTKAALEKVADSPTPRPPSSPHPASAPYKLPLPSFVRICLFLQVP
jgi:hypothetical protein